METRRSTRSAATIPPKDHRETEPCPYPSCTNKYDHQHDGDLQYYSSRNPVQPATRAMAAPRLSHDNIVAGISGRSEASVGRETQEIDVDIQGGTSGTRQAGIETEAYKSEEVVPVARGEDRVGIVVDDKTEDHMLEDYSSESELSDLDLDEDDDEDVTSGVSPADPRTQDGPASAPIILAVPDGSTIPSSMVGDTLFELEYEYAAVGEFYIAEDIAGLDIPEPEQLDVGTAALWLMWAKGKRPPWRDDLAK